MMVAYPGQATSKIVVFRHGFQLKMIQSGSLLHIVTMIVKLEIVMVMVIVIVIVLIVLIVSDRHGEMEFGVS